MIELCSPMGLRIDMGFIAALIINPHGLVALNPISDYVSEIFLYNLLLTIFAILCGYLLRIAIRHFKLDRKTTFLRFPNRWYYLLSGEILDFKGVKIRDHMHSKASSEDIDLIILNVLAIIGGKAIIYTGYYGYHSLFSSGDLENIVLFEADRIELSESLKPKGNTDVAGLIGSNKSNAIQIPGKYIVLNCRDVANVNFNYLDISRVNQQIQKNDKKPRKQ